MSVKIRLSRLGKKNRPYWRIVAIDSRKKRDGACLEDLGTYDPIKHDVVQIHLERIQDWVSKGAICSPTVAKIMRLKKKETKAAESSSDIVTSKVTKKIEKEVEEGKA